MAGILIADLNVYNGPGEDYRLVDSLKRETEVVVTGQNRTGDWWYVEAANLNGWVRAEYVKVAATPFLPAMTAPPPATITDTPTNTATPTKTKTQLSRQPAHPDRS